MVCRCRCEFFRRAARLGSGRGWLGYCCSFWSLADILVLSLGTTANRRLAVAMAAADRDDPHWRLDDLLEHREFVPDAENSSLVLAQSIELLGKHWPSPSASGGSAERCQQPDRACPGPA